MNARFILRWTGWLYFLGGVLWIVVWTINANGGKDLFFAELQDWASIFLFAFGLLIAVMASAAGGKRR